MGVLVTGTGRTGTSWLTQALRSAGAKATHEKHYSLKKAGPIPEATVEVSWLAAPHTPVAEFTIHLVRHPLKVIASRAAWGSFGGWDKKGYDPRPKGRYAVKHCPRIAEGEDPVERAAIHWVEWVSLVDADVVWRIEDVDKEDVGWLACQVGPPKPFKLPGRVNQSKHPPTLTWSDVPAQVKELASDFGYQ